MRLDHRRIARKSVQDYFAPLFFMVRAMRELLRRTRVAIAKKFH
jgi:hypothetical protein